VASSGSQAVMPRIEAEVDVAAGHRRHRVERSWAACAKADVVGRIRSRRDGRRGMRLASITFFGQLR